LVVRVSEAWGARGRVRVSTARAIVAAERVDLLERSREPLPCADGTVALDLRPFELVTLKLALAG